MGDGIIRARPMGKGPGRGPWSDNDESQFQSYMAFDPAVRAWRNEYEGKYGEAPQIDGHPMYDYRKAFKANDGPRQVGSDTVSHWGSSGKSDDHPTEWKARFVDQFGADPDELPGGMWSPQQQEFVRAELQTTFRARAALDAFGLGRP